jgi:hypothetical protein
MRFFYKLKLKIDDTPANNFQKIFLDGIFKLTIYLKVIKYYCKAFNIEFLKRDSLILTFLLQVTSHQIKDELSEIKELFPIL